MFPPGKRTRAATSKESELVEQHMLTDEGELIVSKLTDKMDEMYNKFELLLKDKDERIEALKGELVTLKRNMNKLEKKLMMQTRTK